MSMNDSLPSAAHAGAPFLDEGTFHASLVLERKRAERSGNSFVLILVDAQPGNQTPSANASRVLSGIGKNLLRCTRDTDITGWYRLHRTIGVLFTDLKGADRGVIRPLLDRITQAVSQNSVVAEVSQIGISAHRFPDKWNHEVALRPSDPILYPDLIQTTQARKKALIIKRVIDILLSLGVLIALAPLLVVVAAVIKATSRGPVLFRQLRCGEHGRPFVFLKFRSMYVNNDAEIHREWFRQFISGEAKKYGTDKNGGVFKMVSDPRVTRIGRILRKTSIDELPQLINVLKGDMSLVGPRPPIPYEVDGYEVWHRRRVLSAKPGMTGLWQVSGRSRVTFDEMVRLDIEYARNWSLWLDLKILMRTPHAVISGDGAF